MDKRMDPYCVARLEDEHGVLYPPRGVRSRVAYCTTRPAWREGLELTLRGGFIGADGIYRNAGAARTKLVVEVYDDNLGMWGMALRMLNVIATSLTVAQLVQTCRLGGAAARQPDLLPISGTGRRVPSALLLNALTRRARAAQNALRVAVPHRPRMREPELLRFRHPGCPRRGVRRRCHGRVVQGAAYAGLRGWRRCAACHLPAYCRAARSTCPGSQQPCGRRPLQSHTCGPVCSGLPIVGPRREPPAGACRREAAVAL